MVSLVVVLATARGSAAEFKVSDATQLVSAVRRAAPGDTVLLAGGRYRGGVHLEGVSGQPGRPVVIAAANPKQPPVFEGDASGMHLSRCHHLELRDLQFTGARVNGLNIDDGGDRDTPSRGIVLRGVRSFDNGSTGNQDGIKLSGLADFRLEQCVVERWGRNGSGIDLVGCRNGVIEHGIFRHNGALAGANGVQAKGGSESIVIRQCRFEQAGQRGVNLGGSTGLPYFRPRARGFEAREVTVEHCVFIGGLTPVAYVGSVRCVARFNTIYQPEKWIVRILQENTGREFVPCREGGFTDNLIVFQAGQVRSPVNLGPGTAPGTFMFARNFWYATDRPAASRPALPVAETGGVYGRDPQLANPGQGDFRPRPGSPAGAHGARAE